MSATSDICQAAQGAKEAESASDCNERPPKRRRVLIRNEDVPLQLGCEWGDCIHRFTVFQEFRKHVANHIDQFLSGISQSSEDTTHSSVRGFELSCLWKSCDFSSGDATAELVRHIHFHTFHAKLKSRGTYYLQQSSTSGGGGATCGYDPVQRNMVPDLSEPFRCLWEGCSMAETDFLEAQLFYWHVSHHGEEDGPEKLFSCRWKDCSAVTKSVSKLKEHLRIHSQEKCVACPSCGSIFVNRTKFLDHYQRQMNERRPNHTCSFCKKTFSIERLLRDHVRQHIHFYKCPICEFSCPTPSALNSHIHYRHREDAACLPCPYQSCDYKSKSNHDLSNHVRFVHLGVKVLKCCRFPKCDFRSTSTKFLKQHFRAKHQVSSAADGNLFCCHLCPKRFFNGDYLSKHLKRVHKLNYSNGHSKFKFVLGDDGLYHLQTLRFDTV